MNPSVTYFKFTISKSTIGGNLNFCFVLNTFTTFSNYVSIRQYAHQCPFQSLCSKLSMVTFYTGPLGFLQNKYRGYAYYSGVKIAKAVILINCNERFPVYSIRKLKKYQKVTEKSIQQNQSVYESLPVCYYIHH